jgi:short-subunit dehydrogenase
VNVASLAAVLSPPGIAPYCVSKHGVLAMSDVLRTDLEADGSPVRVSVVLPSQLRTTLGAEPAAWHEWALPTEEVTARIARGIERDQHYIFTHPERTDVVEARFTTILDDAHRADSPV